MAENSYALGHETDSSFIHASYCVALQSAMEEDLVAEFECGEFRCRNMFWEFIYIVGIPAAVLTFVVISACFIACIGCCKRYCALHVLVQTNIGDIIFTSCPIKLKLTSIIERF